MKSLVCILFIGFFLSLSHYTVASEASLMTFEFEGEVLEGVFNTPDNQSPKGIILLVHGYGKTNAVADNWYYSVRDAMLKAGYGTFIWDKMGCGNSTGHFDINQSVSNSADEAIAAIKMLQANNIQGANDIGLWGISRAGWINPIIINRRSEDIRFWISVSGVDGLENFGYLLKQHLIISGKDKRYAELIEKEWLAGLRIAHQGGSYSAYKKATQHLSKDAFWNSWTNGGVSALAYLNFKKDYMNVTLDENTGLQVYVDDFNTKLNAIQVPVLALFGDKDMNVDWRKTKALYEAELQHENLTTVVFPNCNHNLLEANTGAIDEFNNANFSPNLCEGYTDAIQQWLNSLTSSKP